MAWNAFKLCTGLRVVGSVMILVVLAVVSVSYYAIVVANYGPDLFKAGYHAPVAALVIVAFHLLLAMVLWCYFAVVFTDPGSVPSDWKPASANEDMEAQNTLLSSLPANSAAVLTAPTTQMSTSLDSSRMRFCRKCCQFKPPRCHHCSVCGRCVLKMDHHCVWVVNCVGARNYKAFLLFLFYTFLETSLVSLSLLPHFIAFFTDADDEPALPGTLATTFLAFVLDLAFALSVLGFLIMHISLVAGNTTTIEAYEKKATARWRYDLGRRKNFEQVFGTKKLFWFLPMYAEEDVRRMPVFKGLEYPVRSDMEGQEF
ncbi:hypothetical protein SELMODRAFT_449300 [Selaginella moellendorffii]|uniref:S-acyltransferase n=1 Tax=Selaginella moellendorffii TaxID=88036 RepID=D8TEQ2_SELML|nr:probable protein S-acyltransferase 14 [Selaginella moellendorffii]EFJ04865.1 hypothetical protein SELMODRAFT_449300 [Selaginella moellendorffii]|eukprot:XP_002994078.1 probable protein S-acyltransferase 14 [Selaginella moellendorffii]